MRCNCNTPTGLGARSLGSMSELAATHWPWTVGASEQAYPSKIRFSGLTFGCTVSLACTIHGIYLVACEKRYAPVLSFDLPKYQTPAARPQIHPRIGPPDHPFLSFPFLSLSMTLTPSARNARARARASVCSDVSSIPIQ